MTAVAVLAGCGSSSSTSSSSSASSSTSTSSAAATATTSSAAGGSAAEASWAKTFLPYTGGKAGKASGTPIAIGWVNDDGGTVQSPESTAAAHVAINVINNDLGGVQGHPLVLHTCSIVSGEVQGQTCAQRLLNDSSVKFITEGVLTVGAGAFYQTLQGRKPVIGYNPVRVESATAKNAYEVTSGSFGTDPGFLGYLHSVLHAKTASLLYPSDDPAGVQAEKTFLKLAKVVGIQVSQEGYASATTDLLTPLTAARATSTDGTVMFLISTAACSAGDNAAKQLGVKHVLSLSLCLIPDVQKSLGDFPKWTYIGTNESGNIPNADPYVAAWLEAMKTYGAANTAPFAQLAFGTIMTDAKLLNQIGKGANFTDSEFQSAIKSFHGPSMFGPPDLHFGSVPGLPALGVVAARAYTYNGNGQWTDATGGKWVGLNGPIGG
ncbi:MAG: ABC transporter substrate-binding protein [Solirubrobacteraceae bacterium]